MNFGLYIKFYKNVKFNNNKYNKNNIINME